MTKFLFSLSLIGLFSVLCFTNCKKKNNDTPATPTAELLTKPTAWKVTGFTADKTVPGVYPQNNWYTYYMSAEEKTSTITFKADGTYSFTNPEPEILKFGASGNWSLNTDKTKLSIISTDGTAFVYTVKSASATTIVAEQNAITIEEVSVVLTITLTAQ